MKTFDPSASQYDGKHVLVLGLGESGLAMVLWLMRCGALVRVADTRAQPERLQELHAAAPCVEFIAGVFSASLLESIDLVAVSPGLSPLRELAAITEAAGSCGIPLVGEIELFAQALLAMRATRAYVPKVIAVTGTNGKTTVTRMVGLLCERCGLRVQVAGNISPAALDVLRSLLERADAMADVSAEPHSEAANSLLPDVWVLELSSFQLHHTYTLAADVATVLNISQDHLDWHGDLAAYIDAKSRIFGNGTVRVLNRDDEAVMKLASPLSTVFSFGADEASVVDCFGLVSDNGMQWLSMAAPAGDGALKRRKKSDSGAAPIMTTRLMPSDALKIRGRHNAVNALAALALCRAIGLPLAPLLHGLREYAGEPHRVELIAVVSDVSYFDDSKGTNVGATVAALIGLGVQPIGDRQGKIDTKRIWLIAGGEGKGQDFTPLADPVGRYARAVLLIGRDAQRIRAALGPSHVELVECVSLAAGVEYAAAHASAGDIVLLSPACASFDMFDNYAHRAAVFTHAVRDIASTRGEVLV
ncbi:MAG: UDP-N-acetylmuramoyl-L-alanine--D-glutamate ligase [Burkholderiaceae bacterium]